MVPAVAPRRRQRFMATFHRRPMAPFPMAPFHADQGADARRLQRAWRAHRVRRASSIIRKLPPDLRLLTVRLAQDACLVRAAALRESITRIVKARVRACGVSLGEALVLSGSWEAADLRDHYAELCAAYSLAVQHRTSLPHELIFDMLSTAHFYEIRCQKDTSAAWKACQRAMQAFACTEVEPTT